MQELVKIVVDAMGGDNAPQSTVKGAVDALNKSQEISVFLVGQEEVINKELEQYTYPKERLTVVPASEVIEMAEPPVMAIRKKKDSSIVVGMKMVHNGEADAFVSAGSTGAVLVGGQLVVGRVKGVERPPLAPLIPTEKGFSLLIDCGANVDARPSHLVQFARMGSIYMENIMGVKNPRVGIVNIGMPSNEAYGRAFLGECGGSLYGNVDMHQNTLKNLPTPVEDGDAVSKAYLEQRLPHLYAQGLGFVAARNYAAVVVAQHNNGHAVERRVEDPLARDEEIVAVAESNHSCIAAQWILHFLYYITFLFLQVEKNHFLQQE